ncbi:MAG: DUF1385 domain-containing protein [Deltaproteobacteria bacterium]|nr:DUF1385 domain-containing protein [Deltaproteobacteria bacterium]
MKKALLVLPRALLSADQAEGSDLGTQNPDAKDLNPTDLAQPDQTPDAKPALAKNVGGQAVIEGVMMRGRDRWAVMVREPDGKVVGQTNPHRAWNRKRPWNLPFVRGLVVLVESMVLGVKALNYSTEIVMAQIEEQQKAEKKAKKLAKKAAKKAAKNASSAIGDAEPAVPSAITTDQPKDTVAIANAEPAGPPAIANNQPSEALEVADAKPADVPIALAEGSDAAPDLVGAAGADAKAKKKADGKGAHTFEIVLSLVVGLGLGVVLFVALPHVLSFWLGRLGGFDETSFIFHFLDGIIKFAIFLAYIYLIGLIPDIARVYAYHGAEHQAIHVYEAGLPLEPSSAKSFPTWHPRCGTAFLFLVLAASLLFFAIVFPLLPSFDGLNRVPRILAGVGLKILCTPFLAGLAYEIAKLASKPDSGPIWRAMVWPGLILQRLTTRLPDDSMLEVAFKSLEAVIPTPEAPTANA